MFSMYLFLFACKHNPTQFNYFLILVAKRISDFFAQLNVLSMVVYFIISIVYLFITSGLGIAS